MDALVDREKEVKAETLSEHSIMCRPKHYSMLWHKRWQRWRPCIKVSKWP